MAKKKRVGKTVKKKSSILKDANKNNHFYVSDGSTIKSVKELAHRLEAMSEDAFLHHVDSTKNDFSNWVSDVFHDKVLAKELSSVKKRVDAHVCVLKHLVKELSK